jgi:hypothetical protein
MYIINAPWVFRSAWGMVKPWVDAKTLDKIHVRGTGGSRRGGGRGLLRRYGVGRGGGEMRQRAPGSREGGYWGTQRTCVYCVGHAGWKPQEAAARAGGS